MLWNITQNRRIISDDRDRVAVKSMLHPGEGLANLVAEHPVCSDKDLIARVLMPVWRVIVLIEGPHSVNSNGRLASAAAAAQEYRAVLLVAQTLVYELVLQQHIASLVSFYRRHDSYIGDMTHIQELHTCNSILQTFSAYIGDMTHI